jgi:hypothetical protein
MVANRLHPEVGMAHMLRRARGAFAVRGAMSLLAAAGLVGCLFPSFDAFVEPAGEPRGGDTGREAGVSPAPDAEPSPPTLGGIGDADGGETGTPESTATTSPTITCGGAPCEASSSICCVAVTGGEACRPRGTGGCATTLSCDDSADCAAGGVCCLGFGTATCGSGCFGQILCDPKAPRCPSDMPRCAYPVPGGRFSCGW